MSTQINVATTEGGQDLVREAKTQQSASRLAFQEKETAKAEAEKTKRRRSSDAAAQSATTVTGPPASGAAAPTTGPSSGFSFGEGDEYIPVSIEDELAANRFGGLTLAGLWIRTNFPATDDLIETNAFLWPYETYKIIIDRVAFPALDNQIIDFQENNLELKQYYYQGYEKPNVSPEFTVIPFINGIQDFFETGDNVPPGRYTSTTEGGVTVWNHFYDDVLAVGDSVAVDGTPGTYRSNTFSFHTEDISTNFLFLSRDWICLPVEKDLMIAIHIRRHARPWYRALTTTDESTETYLTAYGGPLPGDFVHCGVRTTFRSVGTENRLKDVSRYYMYLVSKRAIKAFEENEMPSELKSRLDAIYPDLGSAYTATQSVPIVSYTREDSCGPNTEEISTYGYGYIDENYWWELSAYPYRRDAQLFLNTYARHYGLGRLRTTNHASSEFFTPAIYTWLKGDMDIGGLPDFVPSYQDLRSDYFARAPRQYIDPRLDPEEETVGITRRQPDRPNEAVPVESLVRKKLERSQMSLVCWDWGQPAYCRQQLAELGFSNDDLTF